MLDKILTRTSLLEKALDASWLRNEVISQNIANVDTPNYKRKSVKFEEFLDSAMEGQLKGIVTDKKHIPIGTSDNENAKIEVVEDNNSLSYRLDGNNVDIENEMSQLAKNSLVYNTLVQRISGSFRSIKSVISEGRK